jgi:hypothetical protein
MLKVCCQLIVRACAGTRASNPSRSFSRACELGVGDWLEIEEALNSANGHEHQQMFMKMMFGSPTNIIM